MASTMGGFGPARYVGNAPPVAGASYVITKDDLPRFRVYCTNRGVHIVEDRAGPRAVRPYGRETPLPECSQCGQPAHRSARPQHCPNCGAPWQPVEVGAPYSQPSRLTYECTWCGGQTVMGFTHCTLCGAPHG